MKPKPLAINFEDILKIVERSNYGDLRKAHEIEKYIKQRIKSACEFFMEYYDNPKLLAQDFPELKEEIEKAGGHKLPETDNVSEHFVFDKHFDYDSYNVWLFKLAFNDVFENEKSGDKTYFKDERR